MSATFESLLSLDERLVRAGIPPLTSWWKTTLREWYAGGRRRLVAQVGRGGAKSHTLAKVAINETMFGAHVVPPGERHFAVLVAENVSEASGRLRFIETALAACGIPYTRIGETIELDSIPRGFRVLPCRVGAVSGHRAFFLGFDELAKWAIDGSNPAEEIAGSARAMSVTHPAAREFYVSSPVGRVGLHHELVTQGTTAQQFVASAPSWIANADGITEEQCRSLEPDPRLFRREYGAEPSDSESSAFTSETIDPCIGPIASLEPLGARPIGLFDGSMGKFDAATWAVAQWGRPYATPVCAHFWLVQTQGRGLVREDLLEPGDVVTNAQAMPAIDRETNSLIKNPRAGWRPPPVLAVWALGALTGKFAAHTSFEDMIALAAKTFLTHGAHDIFGDSYMAFALEPAFRKHGLRYVPQVWSNDSKSRAVLRLRQYFREKSLLIEDGNEADALKSELLAFREKVLPSGVLSYGARSGAHDDRVALLINLAMMDASDLLRGSPIGKSRSRFEITEFSSDHDPR